MHNVVVQVLCFNFFFSIAEQIIAAHEKLREVEEKTKSKENDFKTFSGKIIYL